MTLSSPCQARQAVLEIIINAFCFFFLFNWRLDSRGWGVGGGKKLPKKVSNLGNGKFLVFVNRVVNHLDCLVESDEKIT